MAGAALLSASVVISTPAPQAVATQPAAHQRPALAAPSRQWTPREITDELSRLDQAIRESRTKPAPARQAPTARATAPTPTATAPPRPQAGRPGVRQALASAKSTLEQPEADDSDDSEEDGALPAEMNRGAGYDQITELALKDPDTAHALRMLARAEDDGAISAAADPDGPNAGDDGDAPADPAVTTVLSLNNGPILYQPPCPFGWPPPDRYGGLADIIELAPMAGSFISEAFAPAAAWQPMAQLFGPLIAIIQPTIKPNRGWISPTIVNVQNPVNAVHFLFFGWYDTWHRQKFLTEEVEWANEVAPWLQQVYQTPQAACFVAFEGMFQRLVETGNPWPRGWYVEDHATTWDIDKIGPYEPASPGSRPKALQDLDRQLAIEDGDVPAPAEKARPAAPPSKSAPPPQQPVTPQQPVPPPPQETPPQETPPQDPFPGIQAGVEVS